MSRSGSVVSEKCERRMSWWYVAIFNFACCFLYSMANFSRGHVERRSEFSEKEEGGFEGTKRVASRDKFLPSSVFLFLPRPAKLSRTRKRQPGDVSLDIYGSVWFSIANRLWDSKVYSPKAHWSNINGVWFIFCSILRKCNCISKCL